ncbi:MAG: aminotransferase class I/II-fold pyridoxal phosphate-dependent enzyme [Acidimicrobiaceae bacterium]|nr:aminotransferase class I/II-fold pyridoxal phosphate-dependent enzyme [Acidimicrobiaceae bacterium]
MNGFMPPPYPYDRLEDLRDVARQRFGEALDCSIGTPIDAPPRAVVEAMASSDAERGYPPSIGTLDYRSAAAEWMRREMGVALDPVTEIAACIGTKEFVASTPRYLRLRDPSRDTVLYPAVSYPTYAMGATLAGCRAVPVPVDDQWRIDLGRIDAADIERALCLWVNTPGNPAGGLDDLSAAASWGRANDVVVLSDECYAEFTWDGPPRTILTDGVDGVLSVHSLSKRSNLAGIRAGFYAGDPDLVDYLSALRKHAGCMVPGPVQNAAAAAWSDQEHVLVQRDLYRHRLELAQKIVGALGISADLPKGSFYLWVEAPGGDGWGLARTLAERCGVIASPGEFYGPESTGYARIAVVQPATALELALNRAGDAATRDG